MKGSIAAKLDQKRQRLVDVSALLPRRARHATWNSFAASREHAELDPVVRTVQPIPRTEQDVAEAQELLADPEMKS